MRPSKMLGKLLEVGPTPDQMQPHGMTADNYPYFRTDQLDPEDIANFADGAADENFDVDMRTLQDGTEIMVLVPKDQSDEPLAAMDIDRKAHRAADKSEATEARLGELWDDAEPRLKWFYVRDVLRDRGSSIRIAVEYADKYFKLTWEELPPNIKSFLISTVERDA